MRVGFWVRSQSRTSAVSSPTIGPSMTITLITFLVGGPLIYVPVLLAFGGNVHALDPVTWMLGAVFWIRALGHPTLWLMTWIPTALAAIVCSVALRRLARTHWYGRSPRWVVLAVGCIVYGFLSGSVYSCSSRFGVWLGPVKTFQLAPPSNADAQLAAGVRFALLGYGVPLVVVIGALLGGALAWWSYPSNQANKHENNASAGAGHPQLEC